PLINTATLLQLLYSTPPDAVGILTAKLTNPHGFGRIVRDQQGRVIAIVEERDATPQQRDITEINTGIYLLPYRYLAAWLSQLKNNNEQHEFYLTDIVAMAVAEGLQVVTQLVADVTEIAGVNSQQQLATLERSYQKRLADDLMNRGVKISDPARIDIRGDIQVGSDVAIDVNVILQGKVTLGDGVVIGPNVVITNSEIAAGTKILANSVVEGAYIGSDCQIGPFARVRPGTKMHAHSKIGNFVETKSAVIDEHSKINHLSYVGDALLGKRVNIGAGVITCNFDGAAKHTTVIEDDVFVGSNCELIAPITIGKGATIGAGTTLMKDAPANALTLTKKIITNIINWQRPIKQKEEI
ncbi:MAG TPA: bifunctional UDP-N-acetylglucosamine diphosphorylase/glucosamine-1-phosphate N-acetyltransferase GlmU, partial [Gammaproteobacteria bacterium]|nr:bifunctional UDP-N-acetylglucosamine diphosphorylase/glucosamine-1-phosphate N-acetyltransferase GlmU [Gammaproteobacteria bacterium]